MSTSPAASVLNGAAAGRSVSARFFGEHIRTARLLDGRCPEELAPKAGLTAEEWKEIEDGRVPDT